MNEMKTMDLKHIKPITKIKVKDLDLDYQLVDKKKKGFFVPSNPISDPKKISFKINGIENHKSSKKKMISNLIIFTVIFFLISNVDL